jgi:hypothetical protein
MSERPIRLARRTAAPEASATRRDRKTLPRRVRGLPTTQVVTEDGPHPSVKAGGNGATQRPVVSPAVPLACHSQQTPPVPSGQPRTTPRRPRPATFAIHAGSQHSRSGFGSRRSHRRPRSAILFGLEADSNASAAGSSTARGRSGLAVAVAVTFSRRS